MMNDSQPMYPMATLLIEALGYLVNWTSVCIYLSTLAYLYFRRKFSYWQRQGLQTPLPLPYLGTGYHTLLTPKAELELEQHKRLGKLYGLYDGWLGTNPTLVCGHPEAVKQVTIKHFDSFVNRRKPNTWKSIRYRALTYMRDEEWREMRRILAPIFTSNKLKRMFELMKRCTKNLSDGVQLKSSQNQEIDLKAAYSSFTVDIISTCCFSMDLKDFRDSDSELLTNARKFFEVTKFKMFVSMAVPKQILSLIGFDINDVSSIDFFYRFATEIINKRKELSKRMQSNGNAKAASSHIKKADDFLQTLIDAAAEFNDRKPHEATRGSATICPPSVSPLHSGGTDASDEQDLDKQQAEGLEQEEQEESPLVAEDSSVIHSYRKRPQAESGFTERQLGDLEILAQSMLFLAVGHETTATLLSVSSLFLALHPDLQRRLYNEVHEAFQQDKGNITYERLLSLEYLHAFISESLRYYTPTLVFDREASEDVEIEVDGLKLLIPKGMGVVIPFHAIHHDEDNYEDPSRFDPERFMPQNKHKIKPCTFIPFGSGPRHCLASRFAMVEAKLALATLVNKFEFVKSENTVWPPVFRHHYMLLQMDWPKIRFVDRKLSASNSTTTNQAQPAA